MSGLLTVGYFLASLFFNLFIFVLWIRLFLHYYRISALHPVSQMVNTFTNPLLKPIEKIFYSPKSPPKKYDWVCFGFLVIVEFIKFIFLCLLVYGTLMPLSYLLVYVVSDLIIQPCNLLFYIILIRVIMSWVNPAWHGPIADFVKLVSNPLLRLGHYIVPNISGFDFSPFVILIILKVITLFISASLPLNI